MATYLADRQLQDVRLSAWYGLSFHESTDRARGKHLIVYATFERTESVVDITEVKNHVDKVKTKLAQRYVEPDASHGQKDSRLAKFIAQRGSQEKRTIEIKGVDDSGKQATTKVTLHEEKIGEGAGSDLGSCKDLARRFSQILISRL
ncbi:unnamed protein product [Closterium sp. NIES-65]|nr:unnamed protein product [Closterium sp. NIES-65]